ncbi:MAG: quinolinate synthase [Legionellales bacterium]|nr:quinolinate synthase [Legionellales bacterium]
MSETTIRFDSFFHKSDEDCFDTIRKAKEILKDECLLLGHYYQRNEVFQFADITGDSLKLSEQAAKTKAKYIVFCGVHFMAEVADMLTSDEQIVILPDSKAGCSMADMANRPAVEKAWESLNSVLDADAKVMPITYINSAANLKAFCGEKGGTICTSSNAEKILSWALSQRQKVLFFPDQHLGRNTAHALGIPLDKMAVWNFRKPNGGLTSEQIEKAQVLLWDGWCSVHQRFAPEHIDDYLAQYPDAKVIAHPEACFEVCQKADVIGSTSKILNTIEASAPGSRWLVATELNLVNRLHEQFKHENKVVDFMAPTVSMCSTMFRTDPQHLAWVMDNLVNGKIVNQITVDKKTTEYANQALQRMFEITHAKAKV